MRKFTELVRTDIGHLSDTHRETCLHLALVSGLDQTWVSEKA